MLLGEIKLQALMLIFPNDALEYSEDNIEELIYNLKASNTYSSYLSASVGAINRAFCSIEQRGLSGKDMLKLEIKNGTRQGEYISFDLNDHTEILRVSEVYLNGAALDFYMLTDSIINIKTAKGVGEIQLIYLKRLKRINQATSERYEIKLDAIEDAIAYFVKSDLLLGERADEAVTARNIYENMLEEYIAKNGDSGIFQTVYSLGRL